MRIASAPSIVPITQRCASSHFGRAIRNAAIEPAAQAIDMLIAMLMTMCSEPIAIDCARTLLYVSMKFGYSAR